MRRILQIVSWLSLAAVIVPPLAYTAGRLDLVSAQQIMLAATLVWFGSAPFWMGREKAVAGEVG